jgi:phytoene synthase
LDGVFGAAPRPTGFQAFGSRGQTLMTLEASYRLCCQAARRSGSSFYPSFYLLSRPKRRAMCALYAFLRHTDDLADDPGPLELRQRGLAQWRADLAAALAEEKPARISPDENRAMPQSPRGRPAAILPALADCVRRFGIPHEHLYAVLDGAEMDLKRRRYPTFAELEQYCHHVASAVGLACLYIWGFRSPRVFAPARQLGVAYQLTNILRDLAEDARADRVYLPLEDFQRCDYRVEELSAGVVDARFLRLVGWQVDRARGYFDQGAALGDWLEPEGRRMLGLMTATYRLLLDKIDRCRAELLTRRVRLGRWQRLRLAARWLVWG